MAKTIRWRHWTAAALMIAVAIIEPLSVTPMIAYAEPAVKDVSYTIAGRVNGCGIMQGGTTDGQFLYFACSTPDKSKVRIVKSTTSGQVINSSTGFARRKVGHVNDMTYNTKLKLLVLGGIDWGANPGNDNLLNFVDPTTYELKYSKRISNGQSTSNLCYNSTTDQYVIGGKLYDSDLKYQNKVLFTPNGVDQDAGTTDGTVLNQGVECDSKYIYVMRVVWGGKGYNMVATYDWNGNNVGLYKINLNDEGENMSVVGGSFYMGINEGAMSSGGTSANDYFIKIDGINVGGTSARPLVLGSYNVKSIPAPGESGCEAKDRLQVTAKNILDMGMDIVGTQEFGDYDGNVHSSCKGEANKLLDVLNNAGGNWKSTGIPPGTDGGGYQETQASVLYNSGVVKLVSDEAISVLGGKLTDSWGPGDICSGGSPVFHIAGFADASGKTFYVVSGHWCTANAAMRKRITQYLVGVMASYNGQKFIVGDTNSNVGEEVEQIITSSGYGDSHITATQKKNATYGTMYGNAKNSDHIIDRIYYDTSSISTPSYYETFGCNTYKECGSDHKPIAAVFPNVVVGSAQGLCDGNYNKEQFSAWQILYYDPSCACSESSILGLVGDTNFAKIANYFASRGLKDIAVAGILANLQSESHLTPFAIQGQGKNTDSPGEPPAAGGYGIAQFTPATKISRVLQKDARTQQYYSKYYSTQFGGYQIKLWNEGGTGIPEGVPVVVNDAWLNTQLDFFYKGEMQSTKVGSYRNLGGTMGLDYIKDSSTILEALADAQDEKDAARIFVWIYERPADKPGGAIRRAEVATAMLPYVQKAMASDGSSTATVSSGSVGCPDTTTGTDGNFAQTVKAFAWEDGRRVADQKQAYTDALKGRYQGGNNGNDCGAFVSALMVKSGFEPDYPGKDSDGQHAWLEANWDTKFKPGEVDVGQLQAGDVAWKSGHVFVWIGDMSDQGFVGKSAEAAYGSNTAPTAIKSSNTYSDPSLYTWYRKKAN
jgi:hypothetical protein